MKKILASAFFILASSFACFAVPSWLAINTEAYGKDSSPSADTTAYSAYYCSVENAKDLFDGNKTVKGVTTYISAHFSQSVSDLLEQDVISRAINDYVQTLAWDTLSSQYVFTDSFADTLTTDDYLAIILYQNGDDSAVRVLGNAEWTDTNIAFDSQASGDVGDWTAAATPEPTSGLLLLVGLVGIALKRKCCRV